MQDRLLQAPSRMNAYDSVIVLIGLEEKSSEAIKEKQRRVIFYSLYELIDQM